VFANATGNNGTQLKNRTLVKKFRKTVIEEYFFHGEFHFLGS